eukprot:3149959-Prymnesium_polylepis.1
MGEVRARSGWRVADYKQAWRCYRGAFEDIRIHTGVIERGYHDTKYPNMYLSMLQTLTAHCSPTSAAAAATLRRSPRRQPVRPSAQSSVTLRPREKEAMSVRLSQGGWQASRSVGTGTRNSCRGVRTGRVNTL